MQQAELRKAELAAAGEGTESEDEIDLEEAGLVVREGTILDAC